MVYRLERSEVNAAEALGGERVSTAFGGTRVVGEEKRRREHFVVMDRRSTRTAHLFFTPRLSLLLLAILLWFHEPMHSWYCAGFSLALICLDRS